MTTAYMIQLFERQPFEPYSLLLVNGRELHVQHPEMAPLGNAAMILYVVHPAGQIEVIDTALIVSVRTIYPADHAAWIR